MKTRYRNHFQCISDLRDQRQTALFVLLGLLTCCFVVTLVSFLPILRDLKKTWIVYFAVKIVCGFLYLIAAIIPLALDFFPLSFPDVMILDRLFFGAFANELMKFLRMYCYYIFTITSCLNSDDIRMMICHPFEYSDYSKTLNVVKRVLIGTLLSLFLCIDTLANIALLTWSYTMYESNRLMEHFSIRAIRSGVKSPQNIITYISIVKTILFKLVLGVVVTRMALMVKRSLAESRRLASKRSNNILTFILFPVFNSLLYLGHDATLLVNSFSLPCEFGVFTVADTTVRDDFVHIFSATIFFIGYLFNNCLCYLTLLSKLRESCCCKSRISE